MFNLMSVSCLVLQHDDSSNFLRFFLFVHFRSSKELSWTVGNGKTTFLWFHCAALANPPSEPPAAAVHMTYKFLQAETKLVSALLHSHGLREVCYLFVTSGLSLPNRLTRRIRIRSDGMALVLKRKL